MRKIQIGVDTMDNAIHALFELIAGQPLEWNIEPIANVREEIEEALKLHEIEIESRSGSGGGNDNAGGSSNDNTGGSVSSNDNGGDDSHDDDHSNNNGGGSNDNHDDDDDDNSNDNS